MHTGTVSTNESVNRQRSSPVARDQVGDDMVDSEQELPSSRPVREAIEACNRTLNKVYREADARSLQQQKWHRRMAAVAAVLGTVAVLLALVQLAGFFPGPWPPGVEITLVSIAALAVAAGLLLSFQSKWQVERNKAECCRLLKFRFLTDPEYWCADLAGQRKCQERLNENVAALENLNSNQLKDWMRQEAMIQDPTLGARCTIETETLLALVAYYRGKRIGTQGPFFLRRLEQFRSRNRRTLHIPSWLILGSVICALLHFAVDFLRKGDTLGSTLLIFGAAALPVVAAGLRTFRSTYEFARNAMRYEAKLAALHQLDRNLEAELARPQVEPRRIFHDLWCCEQIMEFEHREWLRLMIEAEWY